MNPELSDFAARLRQLISPQEDATADCSNQKPAEPGYLAGENARIGSDSNVAVDEPEVKLGPSDVERFKERLLSPALSSILQMEERVPRAGRDEGRSNVGKKAYPGSLAQKTNKYWVESAPGTGALRGLGNRPARSLSISPAEPDGRHGPVLPEADFNQLALELFALQFEANPAYQALCRARGRNPATVEHWTHIPAVPTAAFKELELSCIPAAERTAVFHSSGTTEQMPSRHFHGTASLAVYEASLSRWFNHHLGAAGPLHFLTPGRLAAPHSSLIYMFDCLRQERSLPESVFLGKIAGEGAWGLDFPAVRAELEAAGAAGRTLTLLGTAFSLVHLLDHLVEQQLSYTLPAGSRVMETGGYKNRSRTLPKAQLHAWITEKLGIPASHIICEYGMSELSSQAYAVTRDEGRVTSDKPFQFPPWARGQIVSPETGREVADGETGSIRVFDLANVFSVAAVQTEDLGIRRGIGFELVGRAEKAEPRGCSLMAAL